MSMKSALRIALSDSAVVMLFFAAPARFVGGLAIGTFLPKYYNRRFPDDLAAYSALNALIVCVGGVTSAYMGGYLNDLWKKRNVRAPAYVPALSALLGLIPFFGVMYA